MENMDKGVTVPKWILINQPRTHQNLPKLSYQSQKCGMSLKKGLIGCLQKGDPSLRKQKKSTSRIDHCTAYKKGGHLKELISTQKGVRL